MQMEMVIKVNIPMYFYHISNGVGSLEGSQISVGARNTFSSMGEALGDGSLPVLPLFVDCRKGA